METKTNTIYTIDARGKKLGRIATEAASVLMGKHTAAYSRNKTGTCAVIIENAKEMDIANKKQTEKKYFRYSGYPGGLKEECMEEIIRKKGYSEVLKRAITGMLPKNKLQKQMLAKLIINE